MRKIILIVFALLITSSQAQMSYAEFDKKKDKELVVNYLEVSDFLSKQYSDEEHLDGKKYALKALNVMKYKKMNMSSPLGANVYSSLGFSIYCTASFDTPAIDKVKTYKESIMYLEKSIEIKTILMKNNPSYNKNSLRNTKKSLAHVKNKLAKTQKSLSK